MYLERVNVCIYIQRICKHMERGEGERFTLRNWLVQSWGAPGKSESERASWKRSRMPLPS